MAGAILFTKGHIVRTRSVEDTLRNSRSKKLFNYRTIKEPDTVHEELDLDKSTCVGFNEDGNPYVVYTSEIPKDTIPYFVAQWVLYYRNTGMLLNQILERNCLPPDIDNWCASVPDGWETLCNAWFNGWRY